MISLRRDANLLWSTVGRALEDGRWDAPALFSGDSTVTYGELAAAIVRGAEEIDARFPAGTRLVLASRHQLHVGITLLAALHSRSTPLLADPSAANVGWPGEPFDVTRAADWLADARAPAAFDPRPVGDDEPAFWTFTSGTTGAPRAVVHAHRAPRFAHDAFAGAVLRIGAEDVTIATGGLPFVYALGNAFFFPLMAGGAAILPSDLLLPTVMGELARHGATILAGGPWSLEAIARLADRPAWTAALRNLRLVLSAGEALPVRVFEEWRSRFGKRPLDNLGATEMFNSFLSNAPSDEQPGTLGRIVPGFEVRVGEGPSIPGAQGELRVRGGSRALAIGERGDEPLRLAADDWCATGDEVAVDANGRFVFLGRVDDRFKVHGQFVHPLAVERALVEVEGVRECLAFEDRDPKTGLPAVALRVVLDGGAEGIFPRLRARARLVLRPFERPIRIEVVGELARSARRKILRPRLPPAG